MRFKCQECCRRFADEPECSSCPNCGSGCVQEVVEPKPATRKYKTKPIDYTDCHPVIAEHLKRGESIECAMEGNLAELHVIAYVYGSKYPYVTKARPEMFEEADGVEHWETAEPIEQTQYVKKASEIVKWLEDNGYSVDAKGCWTKEGCTVFLSSMFRYCGHEPFCGWKWLQEWLETR